MSHLVEIAFGLKRFEPRAGLYMLREVGQRIDPNAKFQIMTFYDTAHRLLGARFIMFGFGFVIYLEVEVLGVSMRFRDAAGNVESEAPEPIYHPRAITFNTSKKHLSHVLQIDWE